MCKHNICQIDFMATLQLHEERCMQNELFFELFLPHRLFCLLCETIIIILLYMLVNPSHTIKDVLLTVSITCFSIIQCKGSFKCSAIYRDSICVSLLSVTSGQSVKQSLCTILHSLRVILIAGVLLENVKLYAWTPCPCLRGQGKVYISMTRTINITYFMKGYQHSFIFLGRVY